MTRIVPNISSEQVFSRSRADHSLLPGLQGITNLISIFCKNFQSKVWMLEWWHRLLSWVGISRQPGRDNCYSYRRGRQHTAFQPQWFCSSHPPRHLPRTQQHHRHPRLHQRSLLPPPGHHLLPLSILSGACCQSMEEGGGGQRLQHLHHLQHRAGHGQHHSLPL